jgi:hypothetical protein
VYTQYAVWSHWFFLRISCFRQAFFASLGAFWSTILLITGFGEAEGTKNERGILTGEKFFELQIPARWCVDGVPVALREFRTHAIIACGVGTYPLRGWHLRVEHSTPCWLPA